MKAKVRGRIMAESAVVLVTICVAAAVVTRQRAERSDKAREVALRSTLQTLREVLVQYQHDRGRYPREIEDLVLEGYLRQVPVDPITERIDTWMPERRAREGIHEIVDVRSGAEGTASDRTRFAQW